MPDVELQALSEAHISDVIAACSDWEELAQFGPPYWRPRSPAELRRKIAATAGPSPATEYTFVIQSEDRLVGEASLHDIDWHNRTAQIGICIWRPEDRRGGYGRAGVEPLLSWAFGHLDLARVEGWIMEDNDASLSLFSNFGFTREATLRSRYFRAGRRTDVHVVGLLAQEWAERQA